MRRYLLNRRSDGRILLRSELAHCPHCSLPPHQLDDNDPLLDERMVTDSEKKAVRCPHFVERKMRMARRWIKCIILAIWIWYLLIWIATPTKVYKKSWRPVIRDMTNSVYFGIQGTAILVNMVPVFLVAVLGCVYLHLGERLSQSSLQQRAGRSANKEASSVWKRTCLVKGPLGIVSWTELAFLSMFIVLLIWSFVNYLYRGLEKINKVKPDDAKTSLVVLESVALWLGLVANICLALMFFPVTRSSSILPLFGLTSESSIRYHIWLGLIAMSLFTAHGLLFILYWYLTDDLLQMLRWDMYKASNLAGEIALLSGILMWVTAFPRIRQKLFELFFYTHHLYIIFVAFFMLHVGINFACMMLPGFYLFVIDRYLRFLQSQQLVKLVSARVLPCKAVELNFAKSPGLKYPPTSHMCINVPSISKLQWHPFTVCSNSDLEPDYISVLIKSEGNWSLKLYQLLSGNFSIEHLPISIEGPYGPASTHFLRYDTLMLVCGGSGITPFISIIRGLIDTSLNAQKTPKVVLISAFKSSSDLTMLEILLPRSTPSSFTLSNLDIQIEAYVTREQLLSSEKSDATSTVWFKPKISDSCISSNLGPNSSLFLALIISSSFASSLIFIGFITKYFIYPIDKNTDKIYPRTFMTLIYMLSFCISIVIAASVAFILCKRRNAKDANHLNNMVHTPDSASGFNPNEVEQESQPPTNFAHVTNVHYGSRPDLRKIVNECMGSSIGVLASGPQSMLSDVATLQVPVHPDQQTTYILSSSASIGDLTILLPRLIEDCSCQRSHFSTSILNTYLPPNFRNY